MNKKILLISSMGGHWVELRRLDPAFEGHQKIYAATHKDYKLEVKKDRFYHVPDASRSDRLQLFICALHVFWLLLRVRPHVIVSTGAAPGFLALFLGKIVFRAKTIWLDSIANFDELSMSGRMVKPYADLWLTQWKHLEKEKGPFCFGKII